MKKKTKWVFLHIRYSQFGSILTTIDFTEAVKDDIFEIRRLGKRQVLSEQNEPVAPTSESSTSGAKQRPLLLSFKSPHSRKDILASAKKLSKSAFKHISICPDLTKNQQEEDKQMRTEVLQLNAENPTDEKGAFLWKVVGVQGQPNRRKVKIYQQNPNENR